MELALSLGKAPKALSLKEKSSKMISVENEKYSHMVSLGLGVGLCKISESKRGGDQAQVERDRREERVSLDSSSIQLELLPLLPLPDHHKPSKINFFPVFCPDHMPADDFGDGAAASSPNSSGAVSSHQMDLTFYTEGSKRESEGDVAHHMEMERASSRVSDEEENGLARKKLRLTREQSAFLEESFKGNNTLNPKQKIELANQLNLRPRQVEVWFQNRRARTKLKQTEVGCEYLKRCCETLTEENRKLQRELQELRALKTCSPMDMQLPATTLTMCPSCEKVAKTTTTATAPRTNKDQTQTPNNTFAHLLNGPWFFPLSRPHKSAAS